MELTDEERRVLWLILASVVEDRPSMRADLTDREWDVAERLASEMESMIETHGRPR